jgi:hypothetical protein
MKAFWNLVETFQEHQNPKNSKLFKIQLWNHSKKKKAGTQIYTFS